MRSTTAFAVGFLTVVDALAAGEGRMDVTAFGVMLEMAAGHSSWWQPQVLGMVAEEAGPLPYWLGALFIKLLPFLSAEFAVRVPFAMLLALTLAFGQFLPRQKGKRQGRPMAIMRKDSSGCGDEDQRKRVAILAAGNGAGLGNLPSLPSPFSAIVETP